MVTQPSQPGPEFYAEVAQRRKAMIEGQATNYEERPAPPESTTSPGERPIEQRTPAEEPSKTPAPPTPSPRSTSRG